METVDIIKVDAKQAETSIKQLRAQLKAYKDEMAGLEEGSSAFLTVAAKAGAVKHQMDEINESVRGASADFGDILSTATQAGSGITAAFAGATGVMQLLGFESEDTVKAIQKLQSLMAVPQGLQGVDLAIKQISKLKEQLLQLGKDNMGAAVKDITEQLNQVYGQSLGDVGDLLQMRISPDLLAGNIKTYEDLRKAVEKNLNKVFEEDLQVPIKISNVDQIFDKNFTNRYFAGLKQFFVQVEDQINELMGLVLPKSLKSFTSWKDKLKEGFANLKGEFAILKTTFKNVFKFGKTGDASLLQLQHFHKALSGIGKVALVVVAGIALIAKAVQDLRFKELNKQVKELTQNFQILGIQIKQALTLTKDTQALAKYTQEISKQALEIQNLNNTYKQWITNQKSAANITRTSVKQQASDLTLLRTQYSTISELLRDPVLQGRVPIPDISIPTYFTDFANVAGMTEQEVENLATSIQTNLGTQLQSVGNTISTLTINLGKLEASISKAENERGSSKNLIRELKLRRDATKGILESFQAYYDELNRLGNLQLEGLSEEINYRLQIQQLAIEQKKNTLEIYNIETEGRKARNKDYDLTIEYFERHLYYLTEMQKLTKKGSAEWEKYSQEIITFGETFRKDFLEEFERNFRQVEKVPEEVDYQFEKMVEKTLNRLQENLDAWNQITGDERRLDLDWIATLDTAEFRAFKKLAGITFEVNRQFELLNETMSLFSQSSLGLGGQWSNVLGEMQQSFNSFSLAVAKGGEATFSDWAKGAANTFQMVGSFLNALSDEQDTQTKEGFKKQKAMQISATVVNMLGGIANAWASAMNPANAWMTAPGQIAVGTVMSAMIAGIGAAQIAKIAQTQFGGGASASGSAINSTIIPPVEYSSLVQGAQTEGAIKDTRVYVVESDIEGVGKKVAVQESENEY